MPCAIRAAERGLSVLVFEKDSIAGGTLHLTAGHLSAAGTRRQQEKGIADTTTQHYEDVKRISRNTMNPLIAGKAVSLAPVTIDWLDELGYPFHDMTPLILHGHEPYHVPRTYFGRDDYAAGDITGSGKMVLKTLLPLWEKWVAAGNIDIFYRHQLTRLQKSGNLVMALEVTDLSNNQTLVISAKRQTPATGNIPVVITTGGYASDATFYTEVMQPFVNTPGIYFPERLLSTASPNAQGDGARAIMGIGGRFEGAEKHISTLGGIELEPGSGRASFWEAWARVSNSYDRVPREIYVNKMGGRFMNEHDTTADERERIVLQQPGQCFYAIFDETALLAGACIVVQWTAEQLKAASQEGKCCWQADTPEGLAAKIGVPADTLAATIAAYNGVVYGKTDDVFGRSVSAYAITQPPYYALLIYAYSLISFGGIAVNGQLQVTDTAGHAIENLYAAGEILGAGATSGNAFCGGMLLTPAISFGKWLGETL